MAAAAIFAGIGAGLSFISAREGARGRKSDLRAATGARQEEAQQARVRIAIKQAQIERAFIRERGSRQAAFGASGIVVTGSAAEAQQDLAREVGIAKHIANIEANDIISNLEREAELFSRQASRINPTLSGLTAAFGGASAGANIGSLFSGGSSTILSSGSPPVDFT